MPYIVTNKSHDVLTFSLNGNVNTLDVHSNLIFTTNPASADLRTLEKKELVTIEFISDAILKARETIGEYKDIAPRAIAPKRKPKAVKKKDEASE
jgi:hypothetical protein